MGHLSQSNALRSIEGNLRDIYREYGPDLSKVRNKDTLKTYKALEAKYAQQLGPDALDRLKKLYEPKVIRFSEAKEKEVNKFLEEQKEKWEAEDKTGAPSELTKLNREKVKLNLGYPNHLVTRKDETPEAYKERRNQLDVVNKEINELMRNDPEIITAQQKLIQKFADIRAHAREEQNKADKANGIVRNHVGNHDLTPEQRANNIRMDVSDNIAAIWGAEKNGYSTLSRSSNAAVASSSYSRSDEPAYVPGQGFNFEEGQAASMNRDRVAATTSNTRGRGPGFAGIVASMDAKKAEEERERISRGLAFRAEFTEKAEESRKLIEKLLKQDSSGALLAQEKELHYVEKNGRLTRGTPDTVLKKMALDDSSYQEASDAVASIKANKAHNRDLALRINTLDEIGYNGNVNNFPLAKIREFNAETHMVQRYIEGGRFSSLDESSLKKICSKYGIDFAELTKDRTADCTDKVLELKSHMLAKVVRNQNAHNNLADLSRKPEANNNASRTAPKPESETVKLVTASNKEAASVSPEALAKAGANLTNFVIDRFKDLRMPPPPSNASQYQTASVSKPPQETKVDETQIKEENKKLYYAHLSAINKGENPDPSKFNIPHSLDQLADAQRVVKEKMNNPALSDETKAKFEKFAAFLDKAIELKSA